LHFVNEFSILAASIQGSLVLTRRFLTVFGIVGVVVMAVLLVLVAFRLVPTSWFLPLFLLAFAIWATRLVLRILISRKERNEATGERQSPVQ
jgi:hypothetical protein